jgi:hypothetical protein
MLCSYSLIEIDFAPMVAEQGIFLKIMKRLFAYAGFAGEARAGPGSTADFHALLPRLRGTVTFFLLDYVPARPFDNANRGLDAERESRDDRPENRDTDHPAYELPLAQRTDGI